ncbi:MAG: hypothetical protein AD742_09400 [Methylibium sp. NZG]|nr:MAG: hypothetical protein AD742_09400 [Methylibium sp. NZG]
MPPATTHRSARPLAGLALAAMLAAMLAAAAVQAAPDAPAAGRYEGRLCVATSSGRPDCGPARVELRPTGQARIRVSDMLYSLTLASGQADVVLMHGAMQIDGFAAPYEWKGSALHFIDTAKGVRYEVRLGERQP